MELDVEGRCCAGYDEKNPERINSRNDYRERTGDTRAGSVELKIPKLRQGSYRMSSPPTRMGLRNTWRPIRRWPATVDVAPFRRGRALQSLARCLSKWASDRSRAVFDASALKERR
jgi:hypothetical protein